MAKVLAGLRPELPFLLVSFGLYVVDLFEAEVGGFGCLLHLLDDLIRFIVAPTEDEIASNCHNDHPHAHEDDYFG